MRQKWPGVSFTENSDFFKDMLKNDFEETQTNKMKVDHWEEKTVSSFLEYIYAEKLTMVVTKDKDTVELTRITLGSNDYIYKRSFDKTKLT